MEMYRENSFLLWFCGTDDINFTHRIALQRWNESEIFENYCMINIGESLAHILFGFAAVSIMLTLAYLCGFRRDSPYLVRLPGHAERWTLLIMVSFVTTASFSEGILTACNFEIPQPHLILPQVLMMLTTWSMVAFSRKAEKWSTPRMSYLTATYWITMVCIQFMRLKFFTGYSLKSFKENSRFTFSVIFLILYFLLMLVETYVLFKKVWFPSKRYVYQPWHIPEDVQRKDVYFRAAYTNFLSQVTYYWVNWLFWKGLKKQPDQKDLGSLPLMHTPETLHANFKKAYYQQNKYHGKSSISLWSVYLRVSGASLALTVCLRLVADSLGYVGPLGVKGLVEYANEYHNHAEIRQEKIPHFLSTGEFLGNGFVLLGVILGATLLKLTIYQYQQYILFTTGLDLSVALQAMVYEKALRLPANTVSRGKMTLGQITNHIAVDVNQIMLFFQNFNSVWAIPLQLVTTLVFLILELGVSALIGTSVLLLILPLQLLIGGKMAGMQKRILACSDKRLKQCNEVLEGIKVIKLQGWDGVFASSIRSLRNKEMKNIISFNVAFLTILLITSLAPLLTTVLAFGTYTAISGNLLTPGKAFSALALFNQMSAPIFLFPMNLTFLVNALVSTRRLEAFLCLPEIVRDHQHENNNCEAEPDDTFDVGICQPDLIPLCSKSYRNGTIRKSEFHPLIDTKRSHYGASSSGVVPKLVITDVSEVTSDTEVAIKLEECSFSWDEQDVHDHLSNINIEIPRGKLTIIIGGVASGKTSLLSAILGEMTPTEGSVTFPRDNPAVAYCSQTPWLLNTSIYNNIIFGSSVQYRDHHKRYRKVLDVCCLNPDLHILPGGDQTEIGEKGITLSGGQKHRISLARALYSHSDIVILDDPLSALDVHVRSEIFQKAIKNFLLKEERTVVMVTHHVHYVYEADHVIVMRDGHVAHQGHPNDLSDSNPYLAHVWSVSADKDDSSGKESDDDGISEELKLLKGQVQRINYGRKSKEKKPSVSTISKDAKSCQHAVEEERAIGSVSLSVYMFYFKAIGYWLCLLIIVFLVIRCALIIAVNVWLSKWSQDSLNTAEDHHDTTYYVLGYVILSAVFFIGMFGSSVSITVATLMAAQGLFLDMLNNVIKAPMRFFDVTPVGRVMNRFSLDTNKVDTRLPQTFTSLLSILVLIVAAAVVNSVINPCFLLFGIPLLAAFIGLLSFYLRTSRELQRLVSVTKSPVVAFFSETLNGLQIIRAFKHEQRFYKQMMTKLSDNTVCFLYLILARRWLGIRLDFLGCMVVFGAGLSTLLGTVFFGVNASYVGLGFTFALQVSLFLNELVKNLSDVELQMNAVERVKHYTQIEREKDNGNFDVPHQWPQRGEISYDHVWCRYSRELDPVIRNMSVILKPAKKVGICGRTGSGKSSFVMALFRMIDTYRGRILIDGVNIADVPLMTLRSRLSVIPQDPVLFSGTVRFNLDPKNKRTDDELWRALEIAQIKDLVIQQERGLESIVSDGGSNFSLGQRQLFCLARAFLRNSTILVMDEATASIDKQTDQIIQDVVAEFFRRKTVLTIAHRISSITKSSNIMVLKEGQLAEFGSPETLKTQKCSLFYELVKGCV